MSINKQNKFFIIYGLVLILQMAVIYIAYLYNFPIKTNIFLTAIICWTQSLCLNMDYPISLSIEKKKLPFLRDFFLNLLKIIPVLILVYLAVFACTYVAFYANASLYILKLHFANNLIVEAYPQLPYYFSIFLCYMLITIYCLLYLWYKVDVLSKVKIFTKNIVSAHFKNYLVFYERIKNKKISFFMYFLWVIGILHSVVFFYSPILAFSFWFDQGCSYNLYLLFCGLISFILCLPKVNLTLKAKYGDDCLHLLGWNMLSGPIVKKATAAVVTGLTVGGGVYVYSRAIEAGTDTATNSIKGVADSAQHLKTDADIVDEVTSTMTSQGKGPHAKEWLATRQDKSLAPDAHKAAEPYLRNAHKNHLYQKTAASEAVHGWTGLRNKSGPPKVTFHEHAFPDDSTDSNSKSKEGKEGK